MEHHVKKSPERLLEPRLVPRALWGISGHRKLTQTRWRRIRQQVLDASSERCRFCEEHREKGMVCDEVWEYKVDDEVACLADLQILCPPCNAVVHVGQAQARLGSEFSIEAIARMASVNGTTVKEAEAAFYLAWLRWHALNTVEAWRMEVAAQVLAAYPDLVVLDGIVMNG